MELFIILIVVVLLFGGSRVADLGSSLGKGIKDFRKNIKDDDEDAPASSAAATTSMANGAAMNGQTVAAVRCPSCGTLNPVSAKHCSQCGSAMTAPVS